ncbi:hypothetical protein Peur_061256 [Populus x canadensis]
MFNFQFYIVSTIKILSLSLSLSRHQTEIQNPVEVSGSAFLPSLPPSTSLSLSHTLSLSVSLVSTVQGKFLFFTLGGEQHAVDFFFCEL